MFTVGIIGPESCGKTTLARELAARHQGVFVPEYARTYLESKPIKYAYTRADVEAIARHQIEELTRIHQENKDTVYFFDTELIITKVWMLHHYSECPPWLEQAVQRYPMDVYLLCAPDIPWQPDPLRENPTIRQELFDWYEREIQALDRPYYIIQHTT